MPYSVSLIQTCVNKLAGVMLLLKSVPFCASLSETVTQADQPVVLYINIYNNSQSYNAMVHTTGPAALTLTTQPNPM